MRLAAWNVLTPTTGLGFFVVEMNVVGFVVPLDRAVESPAYTCGIVLGPVLRLDEPN